MLKSAFNIAAIAVTLGTVFNTVALGGTWTLGLEKLWKLVLDGVSGTLTMGSRAALAMAL